MIKLIQTKDYKEIKRLLRRDKLNKTVWHDNNIDLKYTKFYKIIYNSAAIGVFFYMSLDHNYKWFHGGLYKKYRGNNTKEMLMSCLNHIKTDNSHFITTIKKQNILAQRLVQSIGFKPILEINNNYIYAEVV